MDGDFTRPQLDATLSRAATAEEAFLEDFPQPPSLIALQFRLGRQQQPVVAASADFDLPHLRHLGGCFGIG